jgi:hypothetical protein
MSGHVCHREGGAVPTVRLLALDPPALLKFFRIRIPAFPQGLFATEEVRAMHGYSRQWKVRHGGVPVATEYRSLS